MSFRFISQAIKFSVMLVSLAAFIGFNCLESLAQPNNNNFGNGNIVQNNIGGVRVSAQGMLENISVKDTAELLRVHRIALKEVPGDMKEKTDLRFVSLTAIAKAIESGKELTEEQLCMAGLQRIQYVLVLPETNELVVAGPAEGWKLDELGNIVGVTTNEPVILLDDFIAAFKMFDSEVVGASVSIDPTQEGLQRLSNYVSGLTTIGNRDQTIHNIEEALGPQTITIKGIDSTSHFARVMVAADFRMKRLAMGFEPSPVTGMPSFLQMTKGGRRGMSNILQRWWLAPNFSAIKTDSKRMTWELTGQGVKCMTEEDVLAADGTKTNTQKSNAVAKRWADTMTEKYDELCKHDSTFGQLRNLMDLAVAVAIIKHENLEAAANTNLSSLSLAKLNAPFVAPLQVATKASFVKKGRNYVISASGGVEVSPVKAIEKIEQSPSIAALEAPVRKNPKNWWWQ